jgi:hypothetical protein
MPTATPFTVHSIAFVRPRDPDALPLRDPVTDQLICLRPEWIRGTRNVPAAYLRGARPVVRVVFARAARAARGASAGRWRIGARGAGGPSVAMRDVRLRFDGHGHSAPVTFALAAPLKGAIGVARVSWAWSAVAPDGRRTTVATTRHTLLTTWKPAREAADWQNLTRPKDPPAWRGIRRWAYRPVVEWTCAWAAGRRTEKQICDAVIRQFHTARLRYAVNQHAVRGILLDHGGYCGGFYRLFQALVGAQGVFVHRRSFLVDWRTFDRDHARWCAIVVQSPGVNRRRPTDPASVFHDVNHAALHEPPIRHVRQHRYRFWGNPGGVFDGHCVDILQVGRRHYLYDISFFDRPIALDWTRLPPVNLSRSLPLDRVGNFRTAYLEKAVAFMLGSLTCGGRFYQSRHALAPDVPGGKPVARTENGISVKTSVISGRGRGITFYWGP